MNETGIQISIHGTPPCPAFSMSQGIYALNNSFALVAAGAVRVRWIGRKVGVAMRDPNSRS
jgi:hypothetical protein